jgi:hypothetical protein
VYDVASGERQIMSYRVCADVCLAGAKESRAKSEEKKRKQEKSEEEKITNKKTK